MPKTVLIVEDDADARSIYEEALKKRGYSVLTALHGAEGVHMARRHRPDLILMDIRMPVMDGWQAIQYLKSDPAISHIPIWGISAYLSDDELDNQPAWLHFDRLMSKPVDPGTLVNEIEEALGRPPPPDQPMP
jgi:two-component system, OmpR family, alkaline phosphatase synthesis response regulator PhoP